MQSYRRSELSHTGRSFQHVEETQWKEGTVICLGLCYVTHSGCKHLMTVQGNIHITASEEKGSLMYSYYAPLPCINYGLQSIKEDNI